MIIFVSLLRMSTAFNRTFVELKSYQIAPFADAKASFNRTFVELKYATVNKTLRGLLAFNRTFVELKYCWLRDELSWSMLLLIEPLWN